MIERKKYKQLRVAVMFFVLMIVGLATATENYFLSLAGVLTGIVFMVLVRSKIKIKTDEREISIREKAAQMTYVIFAPTIAIGAFLLLVPSWSGLAVFAKGEFTYAESLGMILAYLSLFLIVLYAIYYHFLNRKYGGSSDEK